MPLTVPSRKPDPALRFEPLEHTADAGLRIYGASLQELLLNAAAGLYSLMTDYDAVCEKPAEGESVSLEICLDAVSGEELLMSWLKELLYEFSASRNIFCAFSFAELSETGLRVGCSGTRYDPQIHEQKVEVKAVTWHGFSLKQSSGRFEASVIFDI